VSESAAWQTRATVRGLQGQRVVSVLTLTVDELRAFDTRRAQFLALADSARRLELQLALWEKSVDALPHDPASDARYLQGYQAWLAYEKDARDPVLALDYFSQSAGLGHPLAPLALAYFHGSGYAGFPKNPALATRFRALADLRLVAMASGGDTWAQTFLGYLLVTGDNRRDDDIERPASFEWLPQDKERGMRWLQLAALDGASLPANFGDSSGQLVAWYIVQMYYSWEIPDAKTRWELIEHVINRVFFLQDATKEEWTAVLAEARAIAAETPEMTRARTALDAALAAAEAAPDTDKDPQGRIFDALVQSTQDRLKFGWRFAAQLDSEAVTLAEPTRPRAGTCSPARTRAAATLPAPRPAPRSRAPWNKISARPPRWRPRSVKPRRPTAPGLSSNYAWRPIRVPIPRPSKNSSHSPKSSSETRENGPWHDIARPPKPPFTTPRPESRANGERLFIVTRRHVPDASFVRLDPSQCGTSDRRR